MKASVAYSLSSAGQRAALAAGLSGSANQTTEIEVFNGDLELFSVSAKGELSADCHQGGAPKFPWGWRDYSFDVVPTPADLIAFLRDRIRLRAEAEAAEAARKVEKEQKEADERAVMIASALAVIASATATDVPAGLRACATHISVQGLNQSLMATDYPAVAEFCARWKVEQDLDAAYEAALKIVDAAALAPSIKPATASATTVGQYSVVVPNCGRTVENAWAKLLSSVNIAGQGGYAYEGFWLTCDATTNRAEGDIIVVGGKNWEGSRKRGSYTHYLTAYVVTRVGLIKLPRSQKQDVSDALDMPAAARIEFVLNALTERCSAQIAALDALDRAAMAVVVDEIDSRRAAWLEVKARCESALSGGAGDEKITDIDSAAAAIVAAGFKALAIAHHPDKGGDAATMALINSARKQLVELLKLAAQAVTA